MAAAMAVFCPQDVRLLMERSRVRYMPGEEELPDINLQPYQGPTVNTRDMRDRSTITLSDLIYGL
jgi:hypothetical protein